MEQIILKFILNYRKNPDSQSNPREKKIYSKAGGITLFDFKLYYKVMIIKNSLVLEENQIIDEWNRIENIEMHPCVC